MEYNMRTFRNYLIFIFIALSISGCELFCNCEKNVGPSLVGVYMASDGLPNANIEPVSVYPGQIVRFEGLERFSLKFATDPQNPSQTDVEYESKGGVIKLRISDEYLKLLESREGQNNPDQNNQDIVEIRIKYSILSEGRERDPMMRIIKPL